MKRTKGKIRFINPLNHLVWKLKIIKLEGYLYVYKDVRNWIKVLIIPLLLITGSDKQDIKELMTFDESHCYVFEDKKMVEKP